MRLLRRDAGETLRRLARGFRVVVVTGPRQSGKTTLVRATFPDKPYVSLEDPDEREFALEDPRGFLARFPRGAVFDEVQRVPELFSYLQGRVDERRTAGEFILTGSQHFGLMERITQSLAGRVGILHLLPFALAELAAAARFHRAPSRILPEHGMRSVLPPAWVRRLRSLPEVLFRGLYPPLFFQRVEPAQWYANYVETYVERDLRQLVAVSNLTTFRRFLRMCAARCGQLLNLSGLANDCGISHATAGAWLTVLEASYLVYRLPPYHVHFGKRLVKTPKLYFYDTGLAAWLLDIRDWRQLETHPARGALFESLLIAEWLKHRFNRAQPANAYFWRNHVGDEIDLLLDQGGYLQPVELKSGQTPGGDYFGSLRKWMAWAGARARHPVVVYGGPRVMEREGVRLVPWTDWPTGALR